MAQGSQTLHATCVAINGRGVLITGVSGAGKSALGLALIGLGADLVADDRVILTVDEGLTARCPPAIKGRIEARFVGIVPAVPVDTAKITLAIDLSQSETDRLPFERKVTYLGCDIPLLYRAEGIHFAPAIAQILRHGFHSLT